MDQSAFLRECAPSDPEFVLSECNPTLTSVGPSRFANPANRGRLSFDLHGERFGLLCGGVLALGASTSFAAARAGILAGLKPADLILTRFGMDYLLARLAGPMAVQALMQGLLQGVIAITAYSQAIRSLGVSRAVLLPAMVPAVSILIGIPIVGEIPGALQLHYIQSFPGCS